MQSSDQPERRSFVIPPLPWHAPVSRTVRRRIAAHLSGRALKVALLALLLVAAFPWSTPAGGAIPECGARGPYLNGYLRFPTNQFYEGVHARITAQWGWVCDSDGDPASNFTNAWSMISDNNGYRWAQSGVERGYGTGIRHFSQILRNDNDFFTQYGSYISEGENHGYWQQYDPGCACIHSNVDFTTFISSWFNPKAEWPQPFGVQYFSEAAYRESDVMGYSSTPTEFGGLQVQRSSDHQFQSTPCFLQYLNQNTARWTQQAFSCTQFNLWTYN